MRTFKAQAHGNHFVSVPIASTAESFYLHQWERLRSSRDVRALAEFKGKYPNGPFGEDALRRIELVEWEDSKAANSADVYRTFVMRYPNSVFAEQA